MNGDQIVTISAPRDVLDCVRVALEVIAGADEPETPEQIADVERLIAAIEIIDEALAQ